MRVLKRERWWGVRWSFGIAVELGLVTSASAAAEPRAVRRRVWTHSDVPPATGVTANRSPYLATPYTLTVTWRSDEMAVNVMATSVWCTGGSNLVLSCAYGMV